MFRYLNRAVYPLFCLHLPVTVAVACLVLPAAWPIAVKYSAICATTYTIVFLLHALVIRRLGPAGVVFGARRLRHAETRHIIGLMPAF